MLVRKEIWEKPFKKGALAGNTEDWTYDEEEDYEEEQEFEVDEENEEQGEEDDDQVAFVADEGWFYADEDTVHSVDECLAWDDEEFAQQLFTFTEARNALARARVARGFYPVVVPADSGPQPRYGRGTKGKSKGKGQGKNPAAKPKPSPSKSATSKGKPSGMSSGGQNPSAGGKPSRPAPICYRCGRKGHLSSNCTHPPYGKESENSLRLRIRDY